MWTGPLACLGLSSIDVLDKDQDSWSGIGSLLFLFPRMWKKTRRVIFCSFPPIGVTLRVAIYTHTYTHTHHSGGYINGPIQSPSAIGGRIYCPGDTRTIYTVPNGPIQSHMVLYGPTFLGYNPWLARPVIESKLFTSLKVINIYFFLKNILLNM